MNNLNILDKPVINDREVYHNYPFELDNFQKHAIDCIDKNENVLITAATGSGKTLVAEYAIDKGVKNGKKVIYTSPIKSLSNQKFYEFKKRFPYLSVGILTGDIKFNPLADCIIMTTEILRNLLYNKNIKINGSPLSIEIDVYEEVETVIFDEVHYINDKERGSVWEECIMMLPNKINLVMLSATIGKAEKFALWFSEIKDKKINLIPNDKRVIPLTHYCYIMAQVDDKDMHGEMYANQLLEILTENKVFKIFNYDAMIKIYKNYSINKKKHQSRMVINKVLNILKIKKLTPAIFFVFSKKKCELYAEMVEHSLNSSEDYSEIKQIVNYYIHKTDNPKIYKEKQQFVDLMKLLQKGVCVHHSGLIPVFKEIIEILFSKNLIKVLFATETFAVGVNMPTKTVLFADIRKYDDDVNGFRTLLTHEYLQMSGRAGRRGLDTKGTVIYLPNLSSEIIGKEEFGTMMMGGSQIIKSKFRLKYQFILKMMLTGQNNLVNFVKTSLMNKDINEKREIIKNELYNLMLKQADKKVYLNYIKYFEEYNKLINPDPYFKLSSKQLKKNKTKIKSYENMENFKKIYEWDQKRKELEGDLMYYQELINNDIMKVISFLENFKYITQIKNVDDLLPEKVLIKGIIASQINGCNPILFTELITGGYLDELEVEEIAAILSILIDGKKETNNNINEKTYIVGTNQKVKEMESVNIIEIDNKKLKNIIKNMEEISKRYDDEEYNRGIYLETDWKLNYELVDTAYMWAQGKELSEIKMLSYEGNFINDIKKINNLAMDVEKMAEILGKYELVKKMGKLSEMLLRDIVNMESLYIKM